MQAHWNTKDVDRSHDIRSLCAALEHVVVLPNPKTIGQCMQAASLIVREDLDEYEFLSVLGRGGTGMVFLAERISNREPVVIKMLSPAGGNGLHDSLFSMVMEMIVSSAELSLAQHITKHFSCGLSDGRLFLVREYAHNVFATGSSGPMITNHDLAVTMMKYCVTLQAIHNAGYVSRDVVPSNLMESLDRRIVMTDLGSVRPWRPDVLGAKRMELFLRRCGVSDVAAWLQASQRHIVRDCIGLGLIFYELATGQRINQADRPSRLTPPSKVMPTRSTVFDDVVSRLLDPTHGPDNDPLGSCRILLRQFSHA